MEGGEGQQSVAGGGAGELLILFHQVIVRVRAATFQRKDWGGRRHDDPKGTVPRGFTPGPEPLLKRGIWEERDTNEQTGYWMFEPIELLHRLRPREARRVQVVMRRDSTHTYRALRAPSCSSGAPFCADGCSADKPNHPHELFFLG